MTSEAQINDINNVVRFLAHENVRDLRSHPSVDCIVLCASAVLYGAEYLFDALTSRPDLTKTLVLCGGVGHSTKLMYDSVDKSPKYRDIWGKLDTLPEARVLELMYSCHTGATSSFGGPRILIEDKSTNCGENASKTWELCRAHSILPKSIVVIQDPTMAIRTLASFQKVYCESQPSPEFFSCPTFVPLVQLEGLKLVFAQATRIPTLWSLERFLSLLIGEIPRLRDDELGYGPNGKGFIISVDIPKDVEQSWARLSASIITDRYIS